MQSPISFASKCLLRTYEELSSGQLTEGWVVVYSFWELGVCMKHALISSLSALELRLRRSVSKGLTYNEGNGQVLCESRFGSVLSYWV